jgi:hypothetical protein
MRWSSSHGHTNDKLGNITDFQVTKGIWWKSTDFCVIEVNNKEKYATDCFSHQLDTTKCLYRSNKSDMLVIQKC